MIDYPIKLLKQHVQIPENIESGLADNCLDKGGNPHYNIINNNYGQFEVQMGSRCKMYWYNIKLRRIYWFIDGYSTKNGSQMTE